MSEETKKEIRAIILSDYNNGELSLNEACRHLMHLADKGAL